MDWQLVIDKNREALLTIIVALVRSLGLAEGGVLTTLPFFLYRRALGILRPAEAALRRLIVIAAHELALRGVKLRAPRISFTNFMLLNPLPETHVPSFNLIDPLKQFGQETPQFGAFLQATAYQDEDEWVDRTPISAASLGRRLLALQKALNSIPAQARRLARWFGQRDAANAQHVPHRQSPLRPGPPPASRRRKVSEIDAVLKECHLLAIHARDRRDSS